jgi:hypothetical protein
LEPFPGFQSRQKRVDLASSPDGAPATRHRGDPSSTIRPMPLRKGEKLRLGQSPAIRSAVTRRLHENLKGGDRIRAFACTHAIS